MAAPPRRQVADLLHALVSRDIPLPDARCAGGDVEFSDGSRWRTPGAVPAVQYLCGDEDVARARVARRVASRGLSIDDLLPGRGPHLLDVVPSTTDAVDLTSAAALRAARIDPTYPTDADRLRDRCRAAGDALVASGEGLIAVIPAEPEVRLRYEVVAVPERVDLRVVARRPFKVWFT